jgi:hypothetical protein
VLVVTEWCAEDKLPADLQYFLQVLAEVRGEVLNACTGG